VLLFAAHRALSPMAETDLFFHLKLGDLILDQHRIPFRNLFSFTFPDHPDPDLAWGFQVAVALAHRAGGMAGVVLLKAALFMTATLLTLRACRRRGAGPLGAALATALAVTAADPRLCERPHLVTFVGLGVLANLLAAADAGRVRALRYIPLLALVWANFHAGVFLCVVVFGCWAIGTRLRRPTRTSGAASLPWGTLIALLAATCLALACSPAGLRLPSYLLWHTGLGATRIVDEFRRADPWNDPWFFVELVVCAITVLRVPRRVGAGHVLGAAVVGLLAWRSVRFVAEFALLAAPLAAVGLSAAGTLVSARTRSAVAALSIVMFSLVLVSERRPWRERFAIAEDLVPVEAVEFATRNGLRERMFSDFDVGCYLLWEGWPRYRVFEDARLPAYPDQFHRALDESLYSTPAFQRLLDRFGVDAALVAWPEENWRALQFPLETWALVYRDPLALVFAKRVERHRALIAAHELPR